MAKLPADETPSPSSSSQQEFVVEEYAQASLQQGKSLSQVHKELSGKVREVRQDLYSLINKRYEDFLALNTSLSGIDTTIKDVRPLLTALSDEIKQTHEDFATKLEYIDSRLAYRSAIREKKQMLRLFIDLSQLLDRVESVLREAEFLAAMPEGSLDYIKCLERAAVDLGQIRYFVSKGSSYPFVQMATDKMRGIERTLHQLLEAFLCDQIDHYLGEQLPDTTALIACCLRTYSTLEENERAEEIMRSQLVKPFMLEILVDKGTQSHHSGAGKGMGMDPKTFEAIVNRILEFVGNVAVPLTGAIQNELSSPAYQRLDTRVFWHEISASIMSVLPLVFVPGIPDRFHKNYLTACFLMDEFSRLFEPYAFNIQTNGTSDGMQTFDSECFAEFSRKWQLSAYFSICKTHIFSILEDRGQQNALPKDNDKHYTNSYSSALGIVSRSSSPLSTAGRATPVLSDGQGIGNSDVHAPSSKLEIERINQLKQQYSLRTDWAARSIWAVRHCWSPEIYLKPLAANFWHLTLQIISWYEKTTDDRIAQLVKGNAALGANSAIESQEIDELLDHIHDIYVLKRQSTVYVRATISNQIEDSREAKFAYYASPNAADLDDTTLADNVENLEAETVKRFEPLEKAISYALEHMGTTIVSASCNSLGSQIRRATSQFRHTNREPPTTPSPFVSKLFVPLKNIEAQILTLQKTAIRDGSDMDTITNTGTDEFTDCTRTKLRMEACAGISQELAKACGEALATISKTEASLQRLRKTRVYAGDAATGAQQRQNQSGSDENRIVPAGVDLRGKIPSSDNDKIRRQIWLDIMETGRIIADYGVRAHSDFIDLVDIVAPLGTTI
ncbi:hypothetical protein IW140_006330 [Coemansia sp. RSA 1813]|nr:hypothetical protein EV178_006306 [Coemansia sp. RSA 1646]KAJ1765935.1 hypothetical protein LPJ74_006134 [Coemansia sp. RSA 1843]KAJ2085437.1 hypothetical protein IW138_006329 [Coemansia sp. RSA 986]KAJ2210396.1 hypothetical protein EV179_006273 [Coemansia sp. RSA 487]KAJ2562776.1 hypothetical protein IW140_006330 [Coemansia sp. RSA 1813]